MDFLEKLNYLMKKNKLNKRALSKACDIPYTTITNWYTRGYEGLTVTSLKKLSNYFQISLDYWVCDEIESTDFSLSHNTNDEKQNNIIDELNIDGDVKQLTKQYSLLSSEDQELVKKMINSLSEKITNDKQKVD